MFKNRNPKRLALDLFSDVCIAVALVSLIVVSLNAFTDVFKEETIQPEAEAEPEVEEIRNEATLAFTGDWMMEFGFYDWIGEDYDFKGYLDEVKPLLEADLTITNLETPIGGEELGIQGINYSFNAPYELAEEIKNTGINFVTFANNHTNDRGQQGIDNTLAVLDENGIGHTGAYSSEEQKNEISYVDCNGIKIAILAYTYGTNQPLENAYSTNTFVSNWVFTDYIRENITAQIAEARASSDFVIVAVHWGQEFSYQMYNSQQTFADFLVSQEVDLIIGNHPHNIQPAQIVYHEDGRKTYLMYAMGNFTSAAANVGRASAYFTNMYEMGLIGRMNLKKDEETGVVSVEKAELIPIVNHFEYDYTNFKLIPLADYTEELAAVHFQHYYQPDFTVEFLKEQAHYVLDDSGMLVLE